MFDVIAFVQGLLATALNDPAAHPWLVEDPVDEDKPRPPASGRWQTVYLPDDTFVVVFDRWRGPRLDTIGVDTVKKMTGARGVLFFEAEIDIES